MTDKEKTTKAQEILKLWIEEYKCTNCEPDENDENADNFEEGGFEVHPLINKETGEVLDFYSKDLAVVYEILNRSFPIRDSMIEYILAFESRNKEFPLRQNIRPHADSFENQYSLYSSIFDVSHAPLGKWPSPFSPSFMQEVAIALFVNKTTDIWPKTISASAQREECSHIFSVNGPPGTGKTTLLKEIVASNVVQKAIAMSNLKNSDDMFLNEMEAGDRVLYSFFEWRYSNRIGWYKHWYKEFGHIKLYIPNKDLVSHSITVTSSNNKAVENISLELPVDSFIASHIKNKNEKDWFTQFDFNTSSLYNYFQEAKGEEEFKKIKTSIWGLVSLCFGNSDNMKTVSEHVLKPLFENLNTYSISYKLEKEKFLSQLEKVKSIEKKIGKISSSYASLEKLKKEYEKEFGSYEEDFISTIKNRIAKLESAINEEEIIIKSHNSIYRELKNKSGITWFSLLFCQNRLKNKIAPIKEERRLIDEAKTKKNELIATVNRLKEYLSQAEDLKKELESIPNKYANSDERKNSGMVYLTEDFVRDLSSEDTATARRAHECNPWTTEQFNQEREKLFLYALEFSMKFCLSSPKFRSNMIFYSNIWTNKDAWDYLDHWCFDEGQVDYLDAKNKRKGFWDINRMKVEGIKTLQLFVPVVSTTFASVQTVYPFLPYISKNHPDTGERFVGSIGTLVVDEAGQAPPYCAVGAMARADSVMVVGDPLQIPPVVTHLKEINKLETPSDDIKKGYLNPYCSVQTFADQINPFGAYSDVDDSSSSIWLGCPLTIHRRCIEPMFTISNKISYSGSMINSTKIPTIDEDIKENYVIKQSCWENICGEESKSKHDKHYVKEQGDFVIKKIKEAISKNKENGLGIYIISPFKSVKNKLLEDCISAGIDKSVLQGAVGTVHTFQGKEAPEVFILLGCDNTTKRGTFTFVSNNILNVAVSRAKKRLCIVGDRALWTGQNKYFKIASDVIDKFEHEANSL